MVIREKMATKRKVENLCMIYYRSNFEYNANEIKKSLMEIKFHVEMKSIENWKNIEDDIKGIKDNKIENLFFIVISHGYDDFIQCNNEKELIDIKDILQLFINNENEINKFGQKYLLFNINQKRQKYI